MILAINRPNLIFDWQIDPIIRREFFLTLLDFYLPLLLSFVFFSFFLFVPLFYPFCIARKKKKKKILYMFRCFFSSRSCSRLCLIKNPKIHIPQIGVFLEMSDNGNAFWYISQPNVLYDLSTTLISQFFS
jgi:hypothetical protein